LLRFLASEWGVLLIILAVAAFLRFYQLDSIPPGLHYDEAGEGLDALTMLRKGVRVFSTTQGGREPLFAYLLAIAFSLWGPQIIILRGLGALAGTLAVGTTYLLVREMFRPVIPNRARWLAALTALGLATGYWQVHLTRMGLRHVLLPPIEALAFYFLWRGLNTGRRRAFVGAGLLLGASLYTYLSARFLPIFLLLFFAVEGVLREITGRRADALWRRHGRNLLLMALLAALVFAPLGYYFLTEEPGEFVERINQVSVFNPALNQGDPLGALWRSATGNYGAVAFHGDEDGLVNLPGRPIFDPLMAVAFVVGLGLALTRARRAPYLFVALWWPVMTLPSVLTYDRVPRFMRAIGTVPGLYVLPALAWVALADRLARRSRLARTLAVLVPIAAYALAGSLTYRDYFLRWGPSQVAYDYFHAAYREVATKMVQEGYPDELWLFPTDLRINYPRRHRYILRFVGYQNLPPEKFLSVDETDMFDKLSAEMEGRSRVVLVQMKRGLQWEADAKGVLPFLLEKYGQLDRVYSTPEYDLRYYTLDSPDPRFRPADRWQPASAVFGDGLTLEAVAYGDASGRGDPNAPQVPSGETLWAALRWRAPGPMAEDYQASLRLVDAGGHVVGQRDNPLISRWHLGATGWHPGEEILDYYLLPVEPGTAPGDYRLEVSVYSPTSLKPLPATVEGVTAGAAQVGSLRVTPALTPPPEPAVETPLKTTWEPGLELVGYDGPPARDLRPGDTLSLALLWRGTSPPGDARLDLTLVGEGGDWPLLTDWPVGGEDFPTGRWRAGEVVRQWLDARLPPDTPSGSYRVRLSSPESGVAVTLGAVQVQGRPRRFELPADLAHPLDVTLGGRVRLAGFDLASPAPGRVDLTLYWQALASMDESYTVFVHVLGEDETIVAQRDQIPQAGEVPTSGWLPGEVVADPYPFSLPAGTYRLAVGMYDAASGRRLPIPGTPDDRLILPVPVEVTP